MTYTIDYHGDAVQHAILALPPKLQARYVALTQRMEQYGAHLGEPQSKALGNGLFEDALNNPSRRRHLRTRAVCRVANPRNSFGYSCGLRLAAHPDPQRLLTAQSYSEHP